MGELENSAKRGSNAKEKTKEFRTIVKNKEKERNNGFDYDIFKNSGIKRKIDE